MYAMTIIYLSLHFLAPDNERAECRWVCASDALISYPTRMKHFFSYCCHTKSRVTSRLLLLRLYIAFETAPVFLMDSENQTNTLGMDAYPENSRRAFPTADIRRSEGVSTACQSLNQAFCLGRVAEDYVEQGVVTTEMRARGLRRHTTGYKILPFPFMLGMALGRG